MRRLRFGDKGVRVRDEPEPPPAGPAGKRPPLVCVHGAGMSSVVFMDLVRRLSPERRVIAPDLPGHGQSDPWHDTPSVPAYAEAVGAICARLGVARAVLVGHSMGAAVALSCALSFPERVAGLVLLNGAGRLPVGDETYALLQAGLPDPQKGAPAAFAGPVSDRLPDALADRMFSPHTLPEVRQRWQAVLLGASQEVTLADFRACAAFDVMDRLGSLKVPVLLLIGADDRMVPPEAGRQTAAALPVCEVRVVQRTGHLTHLESPDAAFAEIAGFVRSLG